MKRAPLVQEELFSWPAHTRRAPVQVPVLQLHLLEPKLTRSQRENLHAAHS